MLAVLLVAGGIVFAIDRAQRGSTGGADVSGVPGLTAVKLDTSGADDFDPDGDDDGAPRGGPARDRRQRRHALGDRDLHASATCRRTASA